MKISLCMDSGELHIQRKFTMYELAGVRHTMKIHYLWLLGCKEFNEFSLGKASWE